MNLTRHKNIVILTGAGISSESGIRTFRAADGLWEDHRIEDVATPEAFARDPVLVHRFYNMRRKQLLEASIKPNAAHLALAKLEAEWEGDFLLVTQNVDNLHERAGSKKLLHMHGALQSVWCQACDARKFHQTDLSLDDQCAECKVAGRLRPDIVWFGEMPYKMDRIQEALEHAEIFISIGTSGHVYPAAGFARLAWQARRIEVNLQSSQISGDFQDHRVGAAGTEVPLLVSELLS